MQQEFCTGTVLSSQAVASQVFSTLMSLTSVFGMGTGGSLSPLSPEFCQGLVQSFVLLALAASLHNRTLRLGNSPHIRACSSIRAYPENRTSKLLTSCFLPVSNFPFGLNSILLDQVLDRLVSSRPWSTTRTCTA